MPPERSAATVGAQRVLVLAPQPFYEDRGTPIALMHVLSAMSRMGVAADVATFPIGADVQLPGVRIMRAGPSFGIVHVPIGLSLRKLLFDVSLALKAWRQSHREHYTAIYASEEAILAAILLGRRFGLPVIYDMQSSMPEQLKVHPLFRSRAAQDWLRRWERWFVRKASVIACSAGLEEHVRSLDPRARLESWRYPGDFARLPDELAGTMRASLAIPDSASVVFYGGTFEHYQGIEELLDAIPRVLQHMPRTVFVLAGASPDEATARAMAALPMESLRIVGKLPRERALQCLAMADIVVSARRAGRNLPLKIIDYMAAGKAIVATDHPAHRIALDESRAVLVAGQSQSIADGILGLLLDRSRAACLGAAAQRYAADVYGRKEFELQVARLLQMATARSSPTLPASSVAEDV